MTTFQYCLAKMSEAFQQATSFRCNMEMLVDVGDLSLKEFDQDAPHPDLVAVKNATFLRIAEDPEFSDFLCFTCVRHSHSKGTQDEIKKHFVRLDRDLNTGREKDVFWKIAIGRHKHLPKAEERVIAAVKYLQEMPDEEREQIRMFFAAGAL